VHDENNTSLAMKTKDSLATIDDGTPLPKDHYRVIKEAEKLPYNHYVSMKDCEGCDFESKESKVKFEGYIREGEHTMKADALVKTGQRISEVKQV
jgi:hypothetical protein